MAKSIRILTEYRLSATLSHGGVIAPVRGVYRAHRGRDTRSQAAGWVSPHIVSRLQAQGLLKPDARFTDRFVTSGAGLDWLAGAPVRRPQALSALPVRGGRDLAAQIFAAPADPAILGQKAAAGRFRDDFRHASQPVMGRLRPVFWPASGPFFGEVAPRLASAVMAALEVRLGMDVMRRLEDVLIDRATLTALSQRWSETPGRVLALCVTALETLAAAYQLSPAADIPARASVRIRSSMEARPFER